MVYAFFIQGLLPPVSQVLYSQVFSETWLSGEDHGPPSRERRKSALETLADRVKMEYECLRRVASATSQSSSSKWTSEAGTIIPHRHKGTHQQQGPQESLVALTGMFLQSPSLTPYYDKDKVVLWCATPTVALVFVLETTENRLLANFVLKLMAKYLQDFVQGLTNPRELLRRPDLVMHVVDAILPQGQLRFMNHKVIKHLDMELEQRVLLARMK